MSLRCFTGKPPALPGLPSTHNGENCAQGRYKQFEFVANCLCFRPCLVLIQRNGFINA
jgi:hypothetical protein